jgi:hypothetical protein
MSALSSAAKYLLGLGNVKWKPDVKSSLEAAAVNGIKNGNGNGNGNGMAKSVKELNESGLFGTFGSNRIVHNTPTPTDGSAEHAHAAIDMYMASQYRTKYHIDHYTELDGTIKRLTNRGTYKTGGEYKRKVNAANVNAAMARAEVGNKTRGAQIKNQTKSDVDPLLFRENDQLNPKQRKELDHTHHIAGLAETDYLFKGRSKEEQQRIIQFMEDTYGIFLGNHQGNAAQLPGIVHGKLHKFIDDLDIEKADVSKLSFDELTDVLAQFADRYQLINEQMFFQMQNRST